MAFPTPSFALFFLVVWLVWAFVPLGSKGRALWLSCSGLYFLATASHLSVYLLLFFTLLGLGVDAYVERTASISRGFSISCVSLILAPLLWLKYSFFFADSFQLIPLLPDWSVWHKSAPAGLSFFTFATCVWVLGSVSRQNPAAPWWAKISSSFFFPPLLSGPICRPKELWPQWQGVGSIDFGLSAAQFGIGFFLKLVCASRMADIADPIFANPSHYSAADLLMAAHAYSGQIYADFAGYTLMALGCASAFGIKLPHNFMAPYLARGPGDFWRRWHMTLSSLWRDYIYIPLGGNRCGLLRQCINFAIVMLLCGLWHGAGWNFLLWGALHAVGLSVERVWRAKSSIKFPPLLAWFLCFEFVTLAWIPFRADNLDIALSFLTTAFSYDSAISTVNLAAIGMGAVLLLLVFAEQYGRDTLLSLAQKSWLSYPIVYWSVFTGMMILCIELSPEGLPSFIYFSF